jgi:hypothetical protein
MPAGCQAICTPACNNDQVCSLRVMTACGVCPASTCVDRSIVGLPPLASSSPSSSPSPPADQSSSNGGLIGGIVGGLAGLGLVLGLGVYCYIKKGKKKRGKLPFAFTNGTVSGLAASNIMSQEKSHGLPPPTVVAVLAKQQQQFIGMAELGGLPMTRTATAESSSRNNTNTSPLKQQQQINTPLYNTTTTNNDNNTNNNTTTTSVPEEFEERIALQNKRISQILNNNPRLSQHQQRNSAFSSQSYDRNSGISYTTDDDSEFDDEESTQHSVAHVVARPGAPYHAQLTRSESSQAIQVTRAKAQIVRVNSVKRSSSTTGLSRSESTRTVLTAVTPPLLPTDGDSKTPPIEEESKELARLENPFIG